MQPPGLSLEQSVLMQRDNLTTLQSHILSGEQRHPNATGSFSWILSALSLSAKVISSKIRRARLSDVLAITWRDVDQKVWDVAIRGQKTDSPARIAMLAEERPRIHLQVRTGGTAPRAPREPGVGVAIALRMREDRSPQAYYG